MVDFLEEDQDKKIIEQEELSSSEEGFLQGYLEEEEILECAECGSALNNTPVKRTIDEEEHLFCSTDCADDFEESI